jgi:BirA family transcriptional regulator, biotin operon repressor / biotin---[acetyl-CoA-carboxylase] ligase
MLRPDLLEKQLPIEGLGAPLTYFESVGSTNDEAKKRAQDGAPHGTLIVANEQTGGRGRSGKRWYSMKDSALAFSLVLRPGNLSNETLLRCSALGALGVVDALMEVGIPASIKWPNDVLIQDRKVAGILVENSWKGALMESIILGVGVNVHTGSVPPQESLDFPATWVDAHQESSLDRGRFLLRIVALIGSWWKNIDQPEFVEALSTRLAYRNRRVELYGLESRITGVLLGLDQEARLMLKTEDNRFIHVREGGDHLRLVD